MDGKEIDDFVHLSWMAQALTNNVALDFRECVTIKPPGPDKISKMNFVSNDNVQKCNIFFDNTCNGERRLATFDILVPI